MTPTILVIGSSNTDMVIKTDHFPKPGETIIGGNFLMNPGGKGANQAVAAARAGGKVTFVAKLGNDIFGKQALIGFDNEGIQTDFMCFDKENPSGVALITVDGKGENSIVVASGANMNLTPFDFTNIQEVFHKNDYVLMQLEIPLDTVSYCAKACQTLGKKVVLNPAPAQTLDTELLRNLYLITPNETETEILTGIPLTNNEAIQKAAQRLQDMGVQNIIITLGAKGVFVQSESFTGYVATPKVTPIDTTAAGDVFNGALVSALAEGYSLKDAATYGCVAASISVTRMGAQASAPTRQEINSLLNK